jgi:methylthioribose-1-phosphate isomerase
MDLDLLRSAVDWRDGRLEIVDQTLLPDRLVVLAPATAAEVVDALRRLAVRGAPAIGVAGAFGVVLGLGEGGPPRPGADGLAAARADLERVAGMLAVARPTAVNLRWAVRRVAAAAAGAADAAELRRLALTEAVRILEEDRAACARMAEAGRAELAARHRLLTHCNTGRLATAGIGTALGVVYAKAAAGEPVQVLASETRPLLQGARLTAWELVTAGIPVTVVADTAAGAAMAGGLVDAVLVGCDREAADGAAIEIEQRPAAEVSTLAGAQLAPEAAGVWNPAFDVTPAALVTAFVTDNGVLRPPYARSIELALAGARHLGR